MTDVEDRPHGRPGEIDPVPADPVAVDRGFTDGDFVPLRRRINAWTQNRSRQVAEDPGRFAEGALTLVVLLVGTALVLQTLHPTDLWRNTTPTGGDMGAHVWGPRYLLDELLPRFRLSGWSPDWYDGFPAYQFYMVVPSLMIVLLHVGLAWFLAIPVVLGALAASIAGWARESLYPHRRVIVGVAAAVVLLSVPISYNRSFKLITAIGLLGVPVACWAFAKLADLPFPIPPLASLGGLLFIYNQNPLYNNTGNIIGGNFQSTMAGEFAFSISLTVAIVYLGVVARGLRTGKHRALAASLFALAGLCHLIPAFFVIACTGALFLIHPDRGRLKWLSTMVPVGGLLTAFWVLPFWYRRDFVNDMGWEKLPAPNSEQTSVLYYLFPSGMRWLMAVALLGVAASLLRRYTVGVVLAVAWAGSSLGFAFIPQYRLWNARILPFMYLSVALLAAIGLGEAVRIAGALASGRAHRPLRPITVVASAVAALGVFIYLALPLAGLFEGPGGFVTRQAVNVPSADGASTESRTQSSWGPFSTTASNPVAGWAGWNYSGLQAKKAQPAGCDAAGSQVACTTGGWPEYRDFVATMAALGQDPEHGCGRSLWEFESDRLNGYGTPMTPMLLPYWTDGCIGSQEGLFFESSTTVPYHFIMQSELSSKPSQPQRDLPYPGFDVDTGVRHLQLLGVKYYMASTDQAVNAAARHPDLAEVAVTGPWHVYEVADAALVTPLTYEPVVADGMGESQDEWLPTAMAWFLDPDRLDVPLAVEGPAEWQRVGVRPVPEDLRGAVRYTRGQLGVDGPMDVLPDEPRTKLPANQVSDVKMDADGISFGVSRPGVPVLVKASYFPNWEVSGAEGPYRVTPNLMVVVPTGEQVTLSYGRTPVDLIGAGLTVLGLLGLVMLARWGTVAVKPYGPGRLSAALDRAITITPSTSRAEMAETDGPKIDLPETETTDPEAADPEVVDPAVPETEAPDPEVVDSAVPTAEVADPEVVDPAVPDTPGDG